PERVGAEGEVVEGVVLARRRGRGVRGEYAGVGDGRLHLGPAGVGVVTGLVGGRLAAGGPALAPAVPATHLPPEVVRRRGNVVRPARERVEAERRTPVLHHGRLPTQFVVNVLGLATERVGDEDHVPDRVVPGDRSRRGVVERVERRKLRGTSDVRRTGDARG